MESWRLRWGEVRHAFPEGSASRVDDPTEERARDTRLDLQRLLTQNFEPVAVEIEAQALEDEFGPTGGALRRAAAHALPL